MRVITFKLDEYTIEKLDAIARAKGVTRSEVIRKAIQLYLKLEDYKIEPQVRHVRLPSDFGNSGSGIKLSGWRL